MAVDVVFVVVVTVDVVFVTDVVLTVVVVTVRVVVVTGRGQPRGPQSQVLNSRIPQPVPPEYLPLVMMCLM